MIFGIATRPKIGEVVCGDSCIVKRDKNIAVIALADGLGHGEIASIAAEKAIKFIEENVDLDVARIIEECHEQLKRTRGAVLGVTRINFANDRFEFAGIGNIGFKAVSKNHIMPISMDGILGYNVRKIKKFEYRIEDGDIISLFSDGISARFDLEEYSRHAPQKAADLILEDHGKEIDDATVVVVKYALR